MSYENRPKDFFAKQIRSSHLIASGGIINPNSSDWDEELSNLRLMIYPKDALEEEGALGPSYIDGAFEGIVPPTLLNDNSSGLNVGEDVWLFISGAQNTHGEDHDASGVVDENELERKVDSGVVLFGGDVVISGTLYAEKQVVEVDLSQEGELFISGNLRAQDHTADQHFVQFMMPMQNYPEKWRRRALTFDDGTTSIDITAIQDAGEQGDYDFSIWASFDTQAPFTKNNFNTTLEKYKEETIDIAISHTTTAISDLQDLINLLSAGIDPSDQDPTVASIQVKHDELEAIIDGLTSESTIVEKTAAWITAQEKAESIIADIYTLLAHVSSLISGGTLTGSTTSDDIDGWTLQTDSINDTISSGSLYAAASDDAPANAELYSSREDIISAGMAVSGFQPEETGDPTGNLTIFNADSILGHVGIMNDAPQAALDLRSGYGHDPSDGIDQDVDVDGDGTKETTFSNSNFWHAENKKEPLSWAHPLAVDAKEVFRIIGLKEDITDYDALDTEPKVMTITDDGYVRFKEGGLGGAKLKEDRDGREEQNTENTNEIDYAADGTTEIVGDDHGSTISGNPYDNGYYVDRWHGDTLVGHALDDVNKALKTIDDNNAWLWPDTDAVEGGDKVTLRDETNQVGIGTSEPVEKLHVYSGESLNTSVLIDTGELNDDGDVLNDGAVTSLKLSFDGITHGTLSQHVKITSLNSSEGTDTVLANHSTKGGLYFSTKHVGTNDNGLDVEYALAPIVADANGSDSAEQLQVLILSGTTGEDATGLNPRLFADTNFFVSGSIGSCVNPDEGISGNGERGTAVFGGDLYVSGAIYAGGGTVGSGGGWRTALNGVCMDVFTESAYGQDGTTPASDQEFFPATVLTDDAPAPENEDDDFSQVYFGFYSTLNGTAGNGTIINVTFDSATASLEPVTITWNDSSQVLDIIVVTEWNPDGVLNEPPLARVTIEDIVNQVNTGVDLDGNVFPIAARAYQTWTSNNISLANVTTDRAFHLNDPTITFNLEGGGDSVRYVSWGGDATSGYSPSEGTAENTGDTFTRQDWAQGLIIPFDCTIIGYSVRYMSKDPFSITAPGVTPTGNEEVLWQIGTLNEGTDPDPGTSYTGDPTTTVQFTELIDTDAGVPPAWIRWSAGDNSSYPLKWIGEGDDGDASHSDTINLSVSAGQTITVRALEKDCDVYSDYRAEASVTLWLQGGSVSSGTGGSSSGGDGVAEDQIRSIQPASSAVADASYTNPDGDFEFKIELSSQSLMNYVSVTYDASENLLLELPSANLNPGSHFVIKDSMGLAATTNIRIAPREGEWLDQYYAWGPDDGYGTLTRATVNGVTVEPLKLEQGFASISVWSNGSMWLIS